MKFTFGLRYHSVWFGTLAVYYFLLAVMRFLLLHHANRKGFGTDRIGELQSYRLCGMILMVMNISLTDVVVFVIRKNEGFQYAGYLIYIMAMYAFYNIITAVMNVVKYRKYRSPVMSAAKVVSLAAALVSMLSLETAMRDTVRQHRLGNVPKYHDGLHRSRCLHDDFGNGGLYDLSCNTRIEMRTNGGSKMIRILVLEDDAKLNQMVCTYLNDSGFQAKGCLHANDAYDEMYNSLYDLIISDIMMPDIDGFEFAESVRRVNKHIPILFMSAKDDLPSKQRGYQLGIDDYMVKPIQLDELLLRVRALLRRANIEMERKVVVGNLELDADGMTASVDGEELPVTTREFNILYTRFNTRI